MKTWKLGYDGFVMQYMIAGPQEEDFVSDTTARDQMTLEGKLRKEIVPERTAERHEMIQVGSQAKNNAVWKVYAPYENAFVDTSKFYSTLKRVSMEVAASLVADEPCSVRAKIWTYMSAAVYLNGKLVGEVKAPVYKPISGVEIVLELKQGKNDLLAVCENLGVRDTRNILGIQILDHTDEISVILTDDSIQDEVFKDTEFLAAVRPENGSLVFPADAEKGVSVYYLPDTPDFYEAHKDLSYENAEGRSRIEVPEDYITASVRISREKYQLERTIELEERIRPLYSVNQNCTDKEKIDEIMERLEKVQSLNRGEFGFAIMNLLARKYLGRPGAQDRELLLNDIELIDQRVDCADFLICGLIRYIKVFGLPEDMKDRTREVLLNFRYWMNMDGMDAMCFWSENHSMMFYSCAMFVGEMYPDDYFPRAKMNGKELHAFGKQKLLEWLDDLEEYGFEEFLSAVYMCVTFAALLNLVDFAEESISQRAEKLCDKLMEELAKHSFRGCVIAPMGRVYRGILYPFSCAIESIINMMDGTAPYCYGEGWLAYMVGSKYKVPESAKKFLKEPIETEYSTGNALVRLKKTDSYCLSSVQSPRQDGWERWENIRDKAEADTETHEFTKSLNEGFHGTSYFTPGTYGYQQHMWMAALSPEAVLFVNHPGTTAEKSGMRPGYWYGNGVMPAIRQQGSLLEAIYVIPEEHPVHFTHVYCPEARFDEVKKEEQWLFLRSGEGYAALWSSAPMHSHNDMIFNCEQRVYGKQSAYICLMGCEKEDGSFAAFCERAKALNPVYTEENSTLSSTAGSFVYQKGNDRTQFVE